ncbi:sterol O-acyltransferase 2 isoform X1 [Amblyraja radiata]|uniref:sterol O-acyltransferase 2 isoform X1 n=1 Tax=Amblyraja radiata TaxID=386614 RepID=UPI001402E701|nr:sterol O-acyltransferase 2 isoform X1 [Amblyraja radiata]XP_032871588.1 sterol O-acyltransferase 2 isoform X1 [Amblyraja radiata]
MNECMEESKVRERKKQSKENSMQNAAGNDSADHGNDLDHPIAWKKHIKDMKVELLDQFKGHLSELLDRAAEESIESYSHYKQETKSQESGHRNRGKNIATLKGKVFVNRCSILDELFENPHIQTIYHMFIALFIVFVVSTMAVEFIDEGRLILDFDMLVYAFGKFPRVFVTWTCLFLYTLTVPYKALDMWGSSYQLARYPRLATLALGLVLVVCQVCVLGIYPIYTVIHYQLPPASRFIVILEQLRLAMKSYSYIRENVPKVLKAKRSQGEVLQMPAFSCYLYFLFCPTLIYRDSYPRTPKIRWKYVALNFAQALGCLFYLYFILVRLCIPVFTNMSKQPFSTKTLVLSIFNATLPGTFILLLFFYSFLHCWLNAFAEMLRFGDRMFYKDWWNSTSFANYYRTWNVVVHDWLYNYTYTDLVWILGKRFRVAAMLSVFILSAMVHEYVLTLCLGYFYPVMFCLFAILGVFFNFIFNDSRTGPGWNIMMWVFLFIGQGIQVCLYCQEWYAQIHCPVTERHFWALVTPRSWYCRPEA